MDAFTIMLVVIVGLGLVTLIRGIQALVQGKITLYPWLDYHTRVIVLLLDKKKSSGKTFTLYGQSAIFVGICYIFSTISVIFILYLFFGRQVLR